MDDQFDLKERKRIIKHHADKIMTLRLRARNTLKNASDTMESIPNHMAPILERMNAGELDVLGSDGEKRINSCVGMCESDIKSALSNLKDIKDAIEIIKKMQIIDNPN